MKKMPFMTNAQGWIAVLGLGMGFLGGCAPKKPEGSPTSTRSAQGLPGAGEGVRRTDPTPTPENLGPFEIQAIRSDGEITVLKFSREKGFFTESPISLSESDEISLLIKGDNRRIRWVIGDQAFDSPSSESFNFSQKFGNPAVEWKGELHTSTPGSDPSAYTIYPIQIGLKYALPRAQIALVSAVSGPTLAAKPYSLAEDFSSNQFRVDWFSFKHDSRFRKNLWIQVPEIPAFRTVTKIGQYFKHDEGPRGYLRSGIYYSVLDLLPTVMEVRRISHSSSRTESQPFVRGWNSLSVEAGELVFVGLVLNSAPSGGAVLAPPTVVGACLRPVAGNPPCFSEISAIDIRAKFLSQMVLVDSHWNRTEVLEKMRTDPDSVLNVFGTEHPETIDWKVTIGETREAMSDPEWMVAQPRFQPRGDVIYTDPRTKIGSQFW